MRALRKVWNGLEYWVDDSAACTPIGRVTEEYLSLVPRPFFVYGLPKNCDLGVLSFNVQDAVHVPSRPLTPKQEKTVRKIRGKWSNARVDVSIIPGRCWTPGALWAFYEVPATRFEGDALEYAEVEALHDFARDKDTVLITTILDGELVPRG